MDTLTIIALAVAVAAVGIAVLLFSRSRRLAAAIDDARARIGGPSPRHFWQRREALVTALQHLERSTAQAQRERSQLAGALQAASSGIVVTDDHAVVVFANHVADEYLGARHGEALEGRLRDVIEQAILNRAPMQIQIELHSPIARYLEIDAVPLDFGVESVGAVAYIRDLTEQRRLDTIGRDFVANVSHELKAPLSALAALAETIADSADEPDVARRMAARLQSEAGRVAALVDGILDLAQTDALSAPNRHVAIERIIVAAAAEAAPRAEEAGLSLITETPPAAEVSGDPRQLTSMLVQLLDNAIASSEPRVREDTAPPRVWLRASRVEDRVVIEVEDEGIGIPEEHLDRVFERFYRVEPLEGATGGPGLGLSIVRNVARSHGGDVSAVSVAGRGSTFTVTLPVSNP